MSPADPAPDVPAGEFGPVAEGGHTAAGGLCSAEPHGRTPIAIIGGTGYVGRLLARRLLSHPTFSLGPIVGSKRSDGLLFRDVWEQKESSLMANYGSQLWNAMPFPPELAHVRVSSLEALLAGPCKLAISCVAPDVGYVEDLLTDGGVTVGSVVVVAPPAVVTAPPRPSALFDRHRPRGAGLLHLAVPSDGEPDRARGQPVAPPRHVGRAPVQVAELRLGRRLDRSQGERPLSPYCPGMLVAFLS